MVPKQIGATAQFSCMMRKEKHAKHLLQTKLQARIQLLQQPNIYHYYYYHPKRQQNPKKQNMYS